LSTSFIFVTRVPLCAGFEYRNILVREDAQRFFGMVGRRRPSAGTVGVVWQFHLLVRYEASANRILGPMPEWNSPRLGTPKILGFRQARFSCWNGPILLSLLTEKSRV
jgi:hypothetical protein